MCLLRKITYGEFSKFVREKKNTYNVSVLYIVFVYTLNCTMCVVSVSMWSQFYFWILDFFSFFLVFLTPPNFISDSSNIVTGVRLGEGLDQGNDRSLARSKSPEGKLMFFYNLIWDFVKKLYINSYFLHKRKVVFVVFFHEWKEWKNSQFNFSSQNLSMYSIRTFCLGWTQKIHHKGFS